MTVKITDEDYPIQFDPPVIVRGADWIGFSFQHMEDDNVTPIDTTDYTAEMIIKESWNGETYKTLTIGDGITMTAAQGLFNISLDKTDIDALDFSKAVYKLLVTDDSGGITPYFMGNIEIVG
jgi:hypothetical protein